MSAFRLLTTAAFFFALCLIAPSVALAGDTGTISGTLTDFATGLPIAGATVNAVSPSDTVRTTTDGKGFFVLQNLPAETYTVSFEARGYDPISSAGINVNQDQTTTLTPKLSKALRTIGSVRTSANSVNLVNSQVGSDTYTVTGPLLSAASGNTLQSETLYTFLATVPGVTVSGGVGAPRIRGGDTHDIGYEFDGIPIRERLFGLFTTNLTDTGLGNVEVTTGGMGAASAGEGAGVINSVVKTGTYPASATVYFGATTPDFNNYYTAAFSDATQDRKLSFYAEARVVRSQNEYNYGNNTYLNLVGTDTSGPVNESDVVANLHFRPTKNDDIQFLFQNGVSNFVFNYLEPGKGQPLPLALQPCPGYTYNPSAAATSPAAIFGASGGIAPNGQACPTGMYWQSITGSPNTFYHYSGIGKIQWNRVIDSHSSLALRFAENYNEYIFSQPLADPNLAQFENPGGYLNVSPACPTYPYASGAPVQSYLGTSNGKPAALECGYDYQSFYGDRKSHEYFGNLDYTNFINSNLTLKAGVSQEYDVNLLNYVGLDSFSKNGSYPNESYGGGSYSDIPTHVPAAYLETDIQIHKLLIDPGIYWSRIWYGAPAILGGSRSAGLFNPAFNGTYSFNHNNVLRFSAGQASSFVGSAYLYRQNFDATGHWVANPSYNPTINGGSVSPEIITDGDLMFEHSFDANTSFKVGPYFDSARNYYVSFAPIKAINPNGTISLGPSVKSANGRHHTTGAEFAFYHTDPRPTGLSEYVSATYDNYWTTSTTALTSASPLFSSLPSYFTNQGILVRSSSNPLFSATFTADYKADRFEWVPQAFYQFDTFYGGGVLTPKTGPPVLQPTSIAGGWWLLNMTFSEKLDRRGDFTVGIKAQNLLNQGNAPTPCQVPQSGDTSSGCASVNGPYSGVHGTTKGQYLYQSIPNYFSPYPQNVELFAQLKL